MTHVTERSKCIHSGSDKIFGPVGSVASLDSSHYGMDCCTDICQFLGFHNDGYLSIAAPRGG